MKITIIYDNETSEKELVSDWGFSCLIESMGKKILFDTGASADILLHNMKILGIDPFVVDDIFISHSHYDHLGGLSTILSINPADVYIPASCPEPLTAGKVIKVKEELKIHKDIFSTGELKGIEQSLLINHDKGVVVITGCSHPGVGEILKSAYHHGDVLALIGGLHGFSQFKLLKDLEFVCPAHCTKFKQKIKKLYPDKYVEGGVGKVIET